MHREKIFWPASKNQIQQRVYLDLGEKILPLNKAIKKAKNMLGLQDISILNHGFQLLQMFLK